MLLEAQRVAVVQACQQLLTSGLLRGTSGNISVRDRQSGAVAITPTGVAYPDLSAADIVVLDADGARLDGQLRPTSEVALHLGVYRSRADVHAIVHTHSMFATVFAALGEQIPAVHYLISRAGGAVPIAPYARYGSPELAQLCVQALADRPAVLLANHGVVAVGPELGTATAVAEAVEYTAELAWRTRQLGPPRLLTDAQLAEAAEAFATYGQADPAG